MTASGTGPAQSLGEAHRYRLDGRIATGGMGEVWRATDTVLGREVAVKLLKNEYADDPTFRTRFEAEARHAAALHHPGVASVFDFGEVPSGDDGPHAESLSTRPFLVMELVPGQPLSALLRDNEPMPPGTAADLVAQAADAIAAAHELGIVHRDVKPANLLVTPQGRVKITDFGIARAADGLALTNTGEVIGTPHYLSPEQAEGKPATAASDIYSLGVVLYECLAGRRPFMAATPVATALAHLREPVPELPSDVPEHMRRVAMKALEKGPADRFATAADLAGALRGGPIGTGAAAAAAESPETRVLAAPGDDDGPPPRRRRSLAAYWPLAVAAAAVLLVIALVSLFSGGDQGDPAGDTPSPKDSQPSDDRVRVREAEYVGMDADAAREKLDALGLGVTEETIDNPGGNTEGTVASVNPHGLVEPDGEITVSAWDAAPVPSPDESDGEGSGAGSGGSSGEGSGEEQEEEPGQGSSEEPSVAPSEEPSVEPSEEPSVAPSEGSGAGQQQQGESEGTTSP